MKAVLLIQTSSTLSLRVHLSTGPEYWNINKRWQVCALGRKQSPIDIRTEMLVYDHLLAPFKLNWLPAAAQLDRLQDWQTDEQHSQVSLLDSCSEQTN